MSPNEPKCTLHCLFARDARKAVIYRRGPSKQTCLISWDLSDDSFRVGQWFKGTVKPSWGALSPNGTWLVSHLGKHTGPFGTWTVLSRPPYFTALALWPKGDLWSGGGVFLSEREMVLRHIGGPFDLAPGFNVPRGLTIIPATEENRARIEAGLPASPWMRLTQREGAYIHKDRDGRALICHTDPRVWSRSPQLSLDEALRFQLRVPGGAEIDLPVAGWATFDGNGDLLFSSGGRLYRLKAERIGAFASSEDLVAQANLLADFSDLRFRGLAAPYGAPRAPAGPAVEEADDVVAEYLPPLDAVSREDRREARRRRKAARRNG